MTIELSRLGFASIDNKIQFFPIPKNASRFINKHLAELHWAEKPIILANERKIFAVIRDPFERWISGFIEDILLISSTNSDWRCKKTADVVVKAILQNQPNWLLDYVFKKHVLDIGFHTELQKDFFGNYPTEQITFFKLDNTLNYKLSTMLQEQGIRNNFINLPKFNVKQDREPCKSFRLKILDYLSNEENQKNKEQLFEFLQPDYNFIQKLSFY